MNSFRDLDSTFHFQHFSDFVFRQMPFDLPKPWLMNFTFQGLENRICINDKSQFYRRQSSSIVLIIELLMFLSLVNRQWHSFKRNGLSNETRHRQLRAVFIHPSFLHYHRPMTRAATRGLTSCWSNVLGLLSPMYNTKYISHHHQR